MFRRLISPGSGPRISLLGHCRPIRGTTASRSGGNPAFCIAAIWNRSRGAGWAAAISHLIGFLLKHWNPFRWANIWLRGCPAGHKKQTYFQMILFIKRNMACLPASKQIDKVNLRKTLIGGWLTRAVLETDGGGASWCLRDELKSLQWNFKSGDGRIFDRRAITVIATFYLKYLFSNIMKDNWMFTASSDIIELKY